MSARSFDHCTCGHNRENHDNFNGECEKCKCEVFHRGMRIENIVADQSIIDLMHYVLLQVFDVVPRIFQDLLGIS